MWATCAARPDEGGFAEPLPRSQPLAAGWRRLAGALLGLALGLFLAGLPGSPWAQPTGAPVLRGGVETRQPVPPNSRGGGQPGASARPDRAIGQCYLLLRNVVQAWQLTPRNVDDCRQLEGQAGAGTAACWARAEQAMALLEQAYDVYLQADRERHSPTSSRLYRQAAALTGQARPLVDSLRDCPTAGNEVFSSNPPGPGPGTSPGDPGPGAGPGGGPGGGPGASPGGGPGGVRPPLTGGVQQTVCPDRVVGWSSRRAAGPNPVWPNDTCYYRINGDIVEQVCRFEWNETAQRCARMAVPRTPRPGTPPTQPPMNDPTLGRPDDYWAGVRAGLIDCSMGVQTLVEAFAAMSRNDFVAAAKLLHMEGQHEALLGIWKDISETPVIDANGLRLSPFEVGRRQAARLCMHAIVPEVQGCLLRSTACVARGAARGVARACAPLVGKLAKLRAPGLKLPFNRPALPPRERGLLPQDHQFLSDLAVSDNLVIILRDSNAAAARWIGRTGFAPKPKFLKAKTLKASDLEHLPPARRAEFEGLVSGKDMSLGELEQIRQAGFEIGSASEMYVIRSAKGTRYYSDVDLHGVYRLDGSSAFDQAFASRVNCAMPGRAMVQHGPHDLWPERNLFEIAGPNVGPQVGGGKTLTALLPDGRAIAIQSLAEMKSLYRAINVDFNHVYPGY